ncbi:MAG: Ig-like domain-containing protein [bacterium]
MKKRLSILFLLYRKQGIVWAFCSVFWVLGLMMPLGMAAGSSDPGPIIRDALFHSPRLTEQWSNEPARAPARAPGRFRETSEYMIGRIAVGIILPESNGSIDYPQTENWTSAEENAIKAEIQACLNWWVAREPAAQLKFITDFHFRVPTGYEPIQHPQTDEGLWISEVMTSLGYPGTNYMDQVYEYNNALREEQGADWAYTIFVVDSSADGDGKFSDGYFAYAWVGGPFVMLTYDNNGYGISNMDAVCAHETGHIFYALDQYAESGCSPTEISGYLAAPNSNCENGGTSYECIMRGEVRPYTTGAVSISAREQIGWRDTDSDEILDIVDINPETSLTPFLPDPTENSTPAYTGSAQAGAPFPNNNPYNPYGSGRSDININIISGVEYRYRLNSGDWSEWLAASAADGAFDSQEEDFTFTTSPLTQGTYDFEVRALNRFGNADSSPAADQLTIEGQDLPPTCTLIQPGGLTWYNGTITLAALAEDSDGVVTQVEFDYSLNGSTWYSCAGSPVTASPYNLSWESWPAGEVDQSVSLRARAKDNQGLYSEYSQVQIKVDNKSPQFSNWVNTPADLTEDFIGSFQIRVDVMDEGIGLQGEAPGLDYRIGLNPFDGYETMTLSGGNAWIFNISEPVDGWENYGGQYLEYKVQAKDGLGNTALSQARQELIDEINSPPTVSLISPLPLAWNHGTINLAAEASDPDGSITQVEFFYSLDGLIWYLCPGGVDAVYPYAVSWTSLPAEGVDESVGLRARAKDNEGLYSTYDEIQIKVDNVPPLISHWVQVPDDLTADHSGPFRIMVAVSDQGFGLSDQVPGLDYQVGSLIFDGYEEMTWDEGDTWLFDISAPGGDWTSYQGKSISYKVEVADGLGNTTTSEVREEFIDEVERPPTCQLISPAPSAWYAGLINLTAEANDTEGIITQVEFAYSLDRLSWAPLPGSPDTTYPYNLTWDSSSSIQVDENVSLRVRAWDNQGLYSDYHEVQIKIDNAPPLLDNWRRIPLDLTETHSGSVRIELDIFDEGAGLSGQVPKLDYQIGSETFGGYQEMTSTGGNVWSFEIHEPESGWEGYRGEPLIYQVEASDAVGNTTLSDLYQELIDRVNLPPVCELTLPAPLAWYAETIPLLAEANDPDGTIAQVEFAWSFDQATWYPVPGSPATASPYGLTWRPSVQTEGSAFIRARARDNEGLYSAYHSIQIMLDNKPPALSNWITVPSDLTADYQGLFQIKVEAVDGGIGLAAEGVKIDYRIGSEAFSGYQVMTSGGGNSWVFNIAEPLEGWSSHGNEYLEYRIKATDALNNEVTGDLMVELIDRINWLDPTCRITSPLPLNWYAGSISLSAEANDTDGTIVQVEFAYSLDGLTWYPVAGSPDFSYPYSLVWDTRQIISQTNQSVQIRGRALDSQGLYSTSAEVTIKVDNEAPDFSHWDNTPADLTADYAGPFQIRVAILDEGVGLLKAPEIDHRIGAGSFSGYQEMIRGEGDTWMFDIPEPVEGWEAYANEYLEYKVAGQDGLGNAATSDLRSEFIQAQSTPPQCRLISPAAFGWYAGRINLAAEASSSNGRILQVEFAYSLDSLTWYECEGSPVSASPYSLVWQTVPSDGVDSQVYLRARSLNSIGAYSDWNAIEVKIDNQPPLFQSFTHIPDTLTNHSTGNVVVNVGILETGSDLEFPGWDWRIGGDAYTGYKQMDSNAPGLYTGAIPEPVQGWAAYAGEYVYYRIKASDRAGNTAFSPEQMIPIQALEQMPPVLDWVAAKEAEVDIHFQDESLPLNLSEASFLIFETDNPGHVLTLFNPVLDQLDQALVHLPLLQFEGGVTYTLKIEGVKDAAENRSPSVLEREFIPVFPDQVTEVIKEDGTGIEIEPGTFDEVVSLEIDLAPVLAQEFETESSVTYKLITTTGRRYEARGTDGALLDEDDFNRPVKIQIPYPEAEEGNDLSIYYLDEAKSVWLELTGEQEIDHNSHLITALASHLSIFCIARLTSPPIEPPAGEDFIVYPNPFRGPDGHTRINFKGPGEQARISIFSVSGQLVKKLSRENWGGGIWSWEVEPDLANGLYIYLILEGGTKKVGKLAIVR